MWIFSCMGTGVPKPHVVQGSLYIHKTILFKKELEYSSLIFKFVIRWILTTSLNPRPHAISVEQSELKSTQILIILFSSQVPVIRSPVYLQKISWYYIALILLALLHKSSTSKIPIELLVMLYKFFTHASCFRASSELHINCLLDTSSWASNSHHAGCLPMVFCIHKWHHHPPPCTSQEITSPSPCLSFHNLTLTNILSSKEVVNLSISLHFHYPQPQKPSIFLQTL